MSFRLTALSLLAITTASSLVQADCATDIQAVMKATETSSPYRVEITSISGETTTVMKGEVIMPHSMRMQSTEMNMVMTPNGVWMGKGETLQKMPDGMRDQIQAMIKDGISMGMKAIEAPDCAEATNFEGGRFELYKYLAKGEMMGIKSTSNVEMYVNGDGKPEWMIIDGEAMGVKSLTKQHITYDDNITISDPQ